ncbi:nucleotidyltransferase domain-containing protein [bacterium]|jgi:predicted nucleotidyltransferase|nr:nucleotidyltransferase domain-containing protein [bacterium]
MARVRKPVLSLENVFFATPEQKLIRFLLKEPTTTFPLRVVASKLKGVRGLGGVDGIKASLLRLQQLHLVEFIDHNRQVRLNDENPQVQMLKKFSAICDLQDLKAALAPISEKVILFGSRAVGMAKSDSDYDLFVVSPQVEEVKKITARHPLGKMVDLVAWAPEEYSNIESRDRNLAKKLGDGIVLWGTN